MAVVSRRPKRRALSPRDDNALATDETPSLYGAYSPRLDTSCVSKSARSSSTEYSQENAKAHQQEKRDRDAVSSFVDKEEGGLGIHMEDTGVIGWLEATFAPFRRVPLRTDKPALLGRSLKVGVQSASIPSRQVRVEMLTSSASSSSSSPEDIQVTVEATTLGINPCSIQRQGRASGQPAKEASSSAAASASSHFFPLTGCSSKESMKETAFLLPQQCTSTIHPGDILYLDTRHNYGFRLLPKDAKPQQGTQACHEGGSTQPTTRCSTPTKAQTKECATTNNAALSLSPRCTVLGRVQRRCIEARRSGSAVDLDTVDENGAVHSRFFSPCRSSNGSENMQYGIAEKESSTQCGKNRIQNVHADSVVDETDQGPSPDRILPPRSEEERTQPQYIVCSICQETEMMIRGQLPCSHSFCFDCISAWSKVSNTCCLCKEPFEKIVKRSPKGHYMDTVKVEPRQFHHEDQDDVVIDEEVEGCMVCDGLEHEDQMLLCDLCDAAYHTFCLRPPLSRIPEGSWFCPPCADERRELLRRDASLMRERQAAYRREEAYERLKRRCQSTQLVVLDSDDDDD
eukprot:gb/GECG01005732.1/.p1 GENE.gb/GECG01005732.1/~~gb/GECG01005732.1/.p1  ORF type:complete len:571 (+),score=64.13 gb/GECG01005732.1/:1-1713(+)